MRQGFRSAGLSALVLCVCLAAPSAWAQKTKKPAARAESSDTEKPAGKAEKPAKAGKGSDAKAAGDKASDKGADAKTADGKAAVVKVETDKQQDGMKTYTFGPQEVEGRLKSPQIQYFLRRVRAEFEAGALGHRSFLRELSHTRHHHSVR